jgi:hypothetical protein
LCRGAIALSRSGFHFPESDLIVKVLGVEASGSDTPRDIFAIMDDFSRFVAEIYILRTA